MQVQGQDSGVFFRQNDSNLFVGFTREPDDAMLDAMALLLERRGASLGRLFVDVRRLATVGEQTVAGVRRILSGSPVPASRVFFKGEQGFALAQNGNKVIVYRKPEGSASGNGRQSLAARRRSERQAAGQGAAEGHVCTCKGGCRDGGPCCGRCHGHAHEHEQNHAHGHLSGHGGQGATSA